MKECPFFRSNATAAAAIAVIVLMMTWVAEA